jgi:serine/threonine protein kinase HipA of HipAB toxin-antitoxin module
VRLLRVYAHPDDVGAFVRYVGFSWITATTDAHLRNFSVLITPGPSAGLAPLYDVASVLGLPKGTWPSHPAALGDGDWGDDRAGRNRPCGMGAGDRTKPLSKAVLTELGALCERVSEEAEGVAERLIAEEGLDAKYLLRLARDLTARANGCQLRLSRPR